MSADKISVAEIAGRFRAILFAARPEIAPCEAAEYRRPTSLGAFALQRVVDFLDGIHGQNLALAGTKSKTDCACVAIVSGPKKDLRTARMIPDPERSGRQVLVDFALQGGGAHGAFTWGVLDRLLDESWLRIEGGTSAGAMNAAILVDGYADGETEAAKAWLELFSESVSRAALLSPFRRTPLDVMLGRWTIDTSPMGAGTFHSGRHPTTLDACNRRPRH